MLELIFSAMAFGIVLLMLPYLGLQLKQHHYQLPLILVLLPLALIATGPAVFMVWPALIFFYIAFLPLAFFALSPGFWLYIRALTAEQPWHYGPSIGWHYVPLVFAAIVGILILKLPPEQQELLFLTGTSEVQGDTLLVAIVFLVAVLCWLVQSIGYLVLIIRQVTHYRRQLRQVFAEEQGRRLGWLEVLLVLLLLSWTCAVLNLSLDGADSLLWCSDAVVLFCFLALVWLLCWVGLTQQPGFADTYKILSEQEEAKAGQSALKTAPDSEAGTVKYRRSALGEQQSLRIAAKLHQAMQSELLYLDEHLTLYKLAEHLAVPAHYLSQTLNQTLQMSFFEYVNQTRVEAAKQKLRQSDESVLSIALSVGFNARSSFYKAFKANTGQSPAEYRQAFEQNKAS